MRLMSCRRYVLTTFLITVLVCANYGLLISGLMATLQLERDYSPVPPDNFATAAVIQTRMLFAAIIVVHCLLYRVIAGLLPNVTAVPSNYMGGLAAGLVAVSLIVVICGIGSYIIVGDLEQGKGILTFLPNLDVQYAQACFAVFGCLVAISSYLAPYLIRSRVLKPTGPTYVHLPAGPVLPPIQIPVSAGASTAGVLAL